MTSVTGSDPSKRIMLTYSVNGCGPLGFFPPVGLLVSYCLPPFPLLFFFLLSYHIICFSSHSGQLCPFLTKWRWFAK